MASWEYFIYSKSGRYSPENIATTLISRGYENGINCKAITKQEINRDHFMVLGKRFEENINIPQGKEGIMFSSGNGNEKDIKNIFNLFQRSDIEVKLNYKFGDIDYKEYFEDAPLEINGKTYFAELKSEKEMMSQSHTPGMHFSNQKEFEHFTRFNDTRYHFYNCTFDDIHFSDNVVIGQFEKCRFNRCTFENFDAESINFNNSVLTDCNIINSNFKNCNFESVGLYQSQISKSDFTNANFATANIKRTRFDENNLSAVKFHGATLNGVIITEPTINIPIEGLYDENITWDGATYEEIETLKKNIFSKLKLEPASLVQELGKAANSLEPLNVQTKEMDFQKLHLNKLQAISDETKSVRLAQLEADMYEGGGYGEDNANARAEAEISHLREDLNNTDSPELKNSKIRFKILKADPITGYKYNVQVHFSHGFHENFVYSGMGRFCKNPEEVKKYINKIIKEYSEYEYQFSYKDIDKNEFFKSQDDLIYNNSFSNEILESKVTPETKQFSELPKIDIENKPLSKEEFDKLTSEIKDIAATYQLDPELLTDYLAFKAQFYQYSPTNTMLIHLQNPHATFVGSYTFWKNKGYGIKKGQHHIKISRPIETSRFPKEINGKTVWTDIKYASSEEKAKIAEGKLEIKKTTKFIPHQVFDISQTTCPVEDYPKFYNMGHPDMEQNQLYECVKQYAKECGFTVTEEDLSSISLHGYYSKTDDSIHINSLLEDSKRLETMCHELAHGVLHKTTTQPVEISEFEAECFGTMLKRKMGFPVSEESKRYINQYFTKSKLLENSKFDIDKTLNRLSKTFNHVSKGIETTMSDMGFAPEREIAQNLSQAKSNAINPIKISENFTQALS